MSFWRSPARNSRGKKTRRDVLRKDSDGLDNGFNYIYEKEVLEISKANIAPFSLPQEVLSLVPTEEEKVFVFKKGGSERKLHNNIELTSDELQQLKELQTEAMNQGVPFYPFLTASATRYIGHCKGDVQKALDMMLATQEWRQTYYAQPLRDVDMMEDLKLGSIYFAGRDCLLRPTLVIRAKRIPQEWGKKQNIWKVIRACLFCVEYFLRYMVVPGRVETFNLIIDLKDMGISQIPMTALKDISDKLGGHYVGRGAKFFICNMSKWLSPLVSVAKGVLSERRAEKLVFINKVEEFQEYYALHQLEEDLGGTMPMVDTFFPFPSPPGPFNARCADGPAANAVAGVHEVLTSEGFRGRLWNPSRTFEENTNLEYSDKASVILKACGLPVPPECDDVYSPDLSPITQSVSAGDVIADAEALISNGEVLLSTEDAVPPRGRPRIFEVERFDKYLVKQTPSVQSI